MQPKLLKNLLVNAKFYTTTEKLIVKNCRRSNCGTCPNMLEGSRIQLKQGKRFTINTNYTCASENSIYTLTCSSCGYNHIGQTSMSRKRRMTPHQEQIRFPTYRYILLDKHIELYAENLQSNSTIFPICQYAEIISVQKRSNKENLLIELKMNA